MSDTRRALVLGASGTLGGAIARTLAARGWRLALHACQHPERLPVLPDALTLQADFRAPEQIQALAAACLKDGARLDALVWAAGITRDAAVVRLAEDDLREVLAVNLTAPFLLAKAFSRQFVRQKAGAFVALSSHAGVDGRAGGAAYAMAQSGLLALVRSLAREWGPLGVRVNAVIPPLVPESGLGRLATPEFIETVRARSVLKSVGGEADAVARFVADLLDNATAAGQVFVLDGRI